MKTAKASKWWSKRNLPDDLWPEILSRLPVKSLLRFRCVSRSWKTWIDAPDFARLHLNRFNNRSESQILFVHSRGQCVVKNSETLRTSLTLGFIQSDFETPDVLRSPYAYSGQGWSIASYFDGLFLLHGRTRLMLWNPSIKKTLLLPPPPQIPLLRAEDENDENVSFGLGFDPSSKDYKVVKIVSLKQEDIHFAAVYTLATNSWKLIECPGEGRQDLDFDCWQSSISFNGVLYGLARDYQTFLAKLASFDLRSEVFTSFELPVTEYLQFHLAVIDNGCSLALIHVRLYEEVFMWVLERSYDTNALSWTQRCSFVPVLPGQLCNYQFLCIKKNGDMLMKCKYTVVCFNLETQQRKILMEKNKKRFEADKTVPYMESLILHR